MRKLSRRGERLRWRIIAAAMSVILLEISFRKVTGWGIYPGLICCAAGYFMGDFVTTRFGGGYFLDPSAAAFRRRTVILPALYIFGRGIDFKQENVYYISTFSLAFLIVALLTLVPEPRE